MQEPQTKCIFSGKVTNVKSKRTQNKDYPTSSGGARKVYIQVTVIC